MEYKKIVFRTFYKFLFPTIIASTAISAVFITDMIIAGNVVGKDAVISIGLSLPLTMFINMFTFFFGAGAANAISIQLGYGNKEKCNKIFTFSILTSIILGVLTAVIGTLFIDELLKFLGAENSGVLSEAKLYIGTIIKGIPFMILAPIIVVFVRNDNNPKLAMAAVLAGGIVNIILDIVFIMAFDMGIFGLALATVISQAVKTVISAAHFITKNSSLKLVGNVDLKCFNDIKKFGMTSSLICIFQTALNIIINRVLIGMGDVDSVAVYALLKYIINFIYAIFDGVTESAQPMLGVYYGEGENRNIKYTVEASLKTILIISAVILAVLEIFAPVICIIFGITQSGIYENAITAIRILALFSVTSAIIANMGAYYRATEKITMSFIIVLFSNFISPISLIFFNIYVLNINSANSVWIALVGADYITIAAWITACIIKNKRLDILMLRQRKDNVDARFTLLIQDKMEDITKAMECIQSFCTKNKISDKQKKVIFLCIEEMVVNIIKIGFNDNKKHYIDIKIDKTKYGDIVIRIRDDNVLFNPEEVQAIDIMNGLENENVNELGVMIVKKIAKSFYYKRAIGFNNLIVVI